MKNRLLKLLKLVRPFSGMPESKSSHRLIVYESLPARKPETKRSRRRERVDTPIVNLEDVSIVSWKNVERPSGIRGCDTPVVIILRKRAGAKQTIERTGAERRASIRRHEAPAWHTRAFSLSSFRTKTRGRSLTSRSTHHTFGFRVTSSSAPRVVRRRRKLHRFLVVAWHFLKNEASAVEVTRSRNTRDTRARAKSDRGGRGPRG